MWDYNKLFTKGNVIGLKDTKENKLYTHVVYEKEDWMDYFNDSLSYKPKNIASEIQYIVHLDEHGNVVEKLFDRDRDMKPKTKPMPELETGMFVRVKDEGLGYVDTRNNRIVYQHGGYDVLDGDEYLPNVLLQIIEVYSEHACAFSYCNDDVLIWRDPDYQAYLDSKYK